MILSGWATGNSEQSCCLPSCPLNHIWLCMPDSQFAADLIDCAFHKSKIHFKHFCDISSKMKMTLRNATIAALECPLVCQCYHCCTGMSLGLSTFILTGWVLCLICPSNTGSVCICRRKGNNIIEIMTHLSYQLYLVKYKVYSFSRNLIWKIQDLVSSAIWTENIPCDLTCDSSISTMGLPYLLQ